jgi:hypothetical protein
MIHRVFGVLEVYFHFWLFAMGVSYLLSVGFFAKEMVRYMFFSRGLVRGEELDVSFVVAPQIFAVAPRPDAFRAWINEDWYLFMMPEGRIYIGLLLEVLDNDGNTMASADVFISPELFFRFPIERAKQHILYSVDGEEGQSIMTAEDMRALLDESAGTIHNVFAVPVSNKTFWIRIVQRTWKRVFREKNLWLRRRGGLLAQRRFELTGNYDSGRPPRLRGMLG